MAIRVGVVSPMAIATDAVAEAFAELWPEATVVNLLDESLYLDFAGGRPQTEETGVRVAKLLHYSEESGQDGVIFAGSVFGRYVEAARADMGVPVLTSYEAMIEAAFEAGSRFGILTTAAGTLRCLVEDIDRYSKARGKSCTIVDHIEDAARPVILAGDVARHDAMVAAAAARMTDCDVLMLGQFSMGNAASAIAEVPGRPVLTAPRTAVLKMKRLLAG